MYFIGLIFVAVAIVGFLSSTPVGVLIAIPSAILGIIALIVSSDTSNTSATNDPRLEGR